MKKRVALCLTLCLMLTLFAVPVLATEEIPVFLDGERLQFDVPPMIISGRTMVPMRGIFEALGAEVHYDPATKSITGIKGEMRIELTVNSREAYKNGELIELDVPATIVNDRTLVPLRFIGESLDCQVHWDETSKTVSIVADVEEEPIDEPGEEPIDEPGEEPGEEPSQEPGDDPGQEPGGDTGDGPGHDPGPGTPASGTVKVSVIVTELFGIKTYTVELHSMDVQDGRYWALGSIDRPKQEVGDEYTASSTEESVPLFVFDANGQLLTQFTIEYEDCTEVTLNK
ncbi:MAG: copper amine oxidase N-terminal domain-containing protein [Bacillota bacterium]|jgi:hypothetical protein